VDLSELTVVILCGGKGTRAYPHTLELPKVLLEVGERTILRHVMDIYAMQGSRNFVLAAGFKAGMIHQFREELPDDWDALVVDSGENANTGERIWECRDVVSDPFFVTYGDGLGNIDLQLLLGCHRSNDGCATLTTVPLRSQYGTVDATNDGRVLRFREKPVLPTYQINGGFFVFSQQAFSVWRGSDLEQGVLPHLAELGQLFSYQHRGFWKSMDTYKDALELTALAAEGSPPWLPTRLDPSSSTSDTTTLTPHGQ